MPARLSKRTIDATLDGALPAIVYDTELKGFGVRVAASGSLSWFVEYRPGAGGRRISKKRLYFGSREFTPEQARQTAKELLASVALGEDPMADRQHDRQSLTFREFAERYLSEEAEAKLSPVPLRTTASQSASTPTPRLVVSSWIRFRIATCRACTQKSARQSQ